MNYRRLFRLFLCLFLTPYASVSAPPKIYQGSQLQYEGGTHTLSGKKDGKVLLSQNHPNTIPAVKPTQDFFQNIEDPFQTFMIFESHNFPNGYKAIEPLRVDPDDALKVILPHNQGSAFRGLPQNARTIDFIGFSATNQTINETTLYMTSSNITITPIHHRAHPKLCRIILKPQNIEAFKIQANGLEQQTLTPSLFISLWLKESHYNPFYQHMPIALVALHETSNKKVYLNLTTLDIRYKDGNIEILGQIAPEDPNTEVIAYLQNLFAHHKSVPGRILFQTGFVKK